MILNWFTNNLGLKLISLILAVGLWHYALGEEGIEVKRTIWLEIQVENDQLSMLEASTSQVKVTLQAPRSSLSQMTEGEMKAIHKIAKDVTTAGDYSFRLQPRDITLPTPQIRVVGIEPEVIKVTLDELIVQKLEIKANFQGEPAFGYTVDEDGIQLDPNAILIEGPKGQMEKLNYVQTAPLDLVGRIRSFRRTVRLSLPENVKTLSEDKIDVYLPIKEEFQEKSYDGINVKVIRSSEAKEKISIEPETISFSLKGSVRQLEKLPPEKIIAYIDLSNIEEGEYDVPVELVLPEDVTLAESSPVVVKATVKRK